MLVFSLSVPLWNSTVFAGMLALMHCTVPDAMMRRLSDELGTLSFIHPDPFFVSTVPLMARLTMKSPRLLMTPPSSPTICMADPLVTAAVVRSSAPFSMMNFEAAVVMAPRLPVAWLALANEETVTEPPEMRLPPV